MIDLEVFNAKVVVLVERLVGSRLSQNNGMAEIVIEGYDDPQTPPYPYASIRFKVETTPAGSFKRTYYDDNDNKVYETFTNLTYAITFYGDEESVHDTAKLCRQKLFFDSTFKYANETMDAEIYQTTNVVPVLNVLSNRRRIQYTFDITFTVLDVNTDTNSEPSITEVGSISSSII